MPDGPDLIVAGDVRRVESPCEKKFVWQVVDMNQRFLESD